MPFVLCTFLSCIKTKWWKAEGKLENKSCGWVSRFISLSSYVLAGVSVVAFLFKIVALKTSWGNS